MGAFFFVQRKLRPAIILVAVFLYAPISRRLWPCTSLMRHGAEKLFRAIDLYGMDCLHCSSRAAKRYKENGCVAANRKNGGLCQYIRWK